MREQIFAKYSLSHDSTIVLYAPTFRRSGSIEPYRIDWGEVIPRLEQMLGSRNVVVLLRLHPNLIGKVDTSTLINHPSVVDVTLYHDMQELLCASNMLITDYSSSMFDYAMLRRPTILYATDVEQYDRGYYYDFGELPFPLARNLDELNSLIDGFDMPSYQRRLQAFLDERLGVVERGVASEQLAGWMAQHSIASPR